MTTLLPPIDPTGTGAPGDAGRRSSDPGDDDFAALLHATRRPLPPDHRFRHDPPPPEPLAHPDGGDPRRVRPRDRVRQLPTQPEVREFVPHDDDPPVTSDRDGIRRVRVERSDATDTGYDDASAPRDATTPTADRTEHDTAAQSHAATATGDTKAMASSGHDGGERGRDTTSARAEASTATTTAGTATAGASATSTTSTTTTATTAAPAAPAAASTPGTVAATPAAAAGPATPDSVPDTPAAAAAASAVASADATTAAAQAAAPGGAAPVPVPNRRDPSTRTAPGAGSTGTRATGAAPAARIAQPADALTASAATTTPDPVTRATTTDGAPAASDAATVTPAAPQHAAPSAPTSTPAHADVATAETATAAPAGVVAAAAPGTPSAASTPATARTSPTNATPIGPGSDLSGGARAADLDGTAGVDASSAPDEPRPAEVAQQVTSALLSLRGRSDGTYRMRLELKPPELGRVELRVELRDGVVSVHMRAEQAHAAEALHRELGRLRERLTHEGVQTGELTVDGRAARGEGGPHHRELAAQTEATRKSGTDAPGERDLEPRATASAATTSVPDGRIDVKA